MTEGAQVWALLVIAIAVSALLIGREIRRNAQARATIADQDVAISLTPPWAPGREGAWDAWHRDGTVGAYVCGNVTARYREGPPLPITRAKVAIVATGRTLVEISVNPETAGDTVLLDVSFNEPCETLPDGAALVVSVDLAQPPRSIARRLCRVTERFAVSGAQPPG